MKFAGYMAPKSSKRRIIVCNTCGRNFDSDYKKVHDGKYHNGKPQNFHDLGAPANPFVASQKCKEIDSNIQLTATSSAENSCTSVQSSVIPMQSGVPPVDLESIIQLPLTSTAEDSCTFVQSSVYPIQCVIPVVAHINRNSVTADEHQAVTPIRIQKLIQSKISLCSDSVSFLKEISNETDNNSTGTVFKKSQNMTDSSKQYNDSISNIPTVDIQIENLLNSNDLEASDFFHITPKHVNDDVRVAYMQKVFRPERQYEFPPKFLHGCKRSLSYRWLNENPFLVYSKKKDTVYCLPCVLFAKGTYDKRSSFVQPHGFSQWHKLGEKIEKHLRYGLDKAVISIHSQSMTDEKLSKTPSQSLPKQYVTC